MTSRQKIRRTWERALAVGITLSVHGTMLLLLMQPSPASLPIETEYGEGVTVTLIGAGSAGPNPAQSRDAVERMVQGIADSAFNDRAATVPPERPNRVSLSDLFGSVSDASETVPSKSARNFPATPSGPSSSASTKAGSSRAHEVLGADEGAEGINLYAAASLPSAGARPMTPPTGDLWQMVSPCWRPASPLPAILMVEIKSNGYLAALPQAIRLRGKPADAQSLLAERAAARALEACAPYAGLGGRKWRVEFPERR